MIALVGAMSVCATFEAAALTATYVQPDITCAYDDKPCDEPPPQVVTALGSWNLPSFIKEDNFDTYRVVAIAFSVIAELSCILMVVKTLRERELLKTNKE